MSRIGKEPRPERILVQEGDEFEFEEFERTMRDKYGPDEIPIDWKELKGKTLEQQIASEFHVLFVRHPRTHEILGIVSGKIYQDEQDMLYASHLLIDPAYMHWGIGKELITYAKNKAEALGISITMIAEPLLIHFQGEQNPEQAMKVLVRYYEQLGFQIEDYEEHPDSKKLLPLMVWRQKSTSDER